MRTQPATEAIQFTVNKDGATATSAASNANGHGNDADASMRNDEAAAAQCALNSAPGECEMCSS